MSTIERAGSQLLSRQRSRIWLLSPDATAAGTDEAARTHDPPSESAEAAGVAGTAAPQAGQVQAGQAPVAIERRRLLRHGLIDPVGSRSRLAEEMRLVKRTLIARRREATGNGESRSRIVLVTSSQPGEGKTFIALNLALSLSADRDFSVLLVDGDITKRSAMKVLGIPPRPGLIDVLGDPRCDPDEAIAQTDIPGLSVLPSGSSSALSTELLESERMRWLTSELARRVANRFVVIDAAPLLSTTEPLALSRHCGQIVFVIEAFKTSESQVGTALQLLDECDDVSLVLNKTPTKSVRYRDKAYLGLDDA